jgi:hypothetical protein
MLCLGSIRKNVALPAAVLLLDPVPTLRLEDRERLGTRVDFIGAAVGEERQLGANGRIARDDNGVGDFGNAQQPGAARGLPRHRVGVGRADVRKATNVELDWRSCLTGGLALHGNRCAPECIIARGQGESVDELTPRKPSPARAALLAADTLAEAKTTLGTMDAAIVEMIVERRPPIEEAARRFVGAQGEALRSRYRMASGFATPGGHWRRYGTPFQSREDPRLH